MGLSQFKLKSRSPDPHVQAASKLFVNSRRRLPRVTPPIAATTNTQYYCRTSSLVPVNAVRNAVSAAAGVFPRFLSKRN